MSDTEINITATEEGSYTHEIVTGNSTYTVELDQDDLDELKDEVITADDGSVIL